MIVRFRKCLLLLAIPILLFLFGTDVKALGLEATDFKVVGKNETIDVDEVIFSDNKVTSNALFNFAFAFTLSKFLYKNEALYTTIYNGRKSSKMMIVNVQNFT